MIDRTKAYPKYRPSGVPWTPQLPAHWTVGRAKHLFTKMNRPIRDQDEVVTCFRDGTVTLRRNRRLRGFTEAIFESGYQGIRRGDLVIHAMDAFAGAVGVSDSDGKGTPVYSVCRPAPEAHPHYFAAVVREMARSQWIFALAKGIRERSTDFRFETFGNQRVPLPPPDEQVAIVRYLAWATGRIDRAIRAKKKVISLLNEQKQAVIHRAVTRGLAPSVPMKGTGVPWLGVVPSHWTLAPNRAFLRIRKVLVGARHGSYQVLSLTKKGVLVRDMSAGGKFSSFWERSQEVRAGDLVFCLFDVEETPRTVGLSAHAGMISGDYTVFECSDPAIAAFVEKFYIAMDDRKLLSPLYSGLRKRIPKPEFLAALTPLPPPDEMARIVRYDDEASSQTLRSIDGLDRTVQLLREYRTRLVADAVSGAVDVRDAASSLPAEPASVEADGEPEEDAEGVEEAVA